MTLKYINDIPYVRDAEVCAAALRVFQDSRSALCEPGNATLLHCENVAVRLVRTYVLMGDGAAENAVLYAKVADLFGALWYFSSGCQTRIKYRALRADLFEKAAS